MNDYYWLSNIQHSFTLASLSAARCADIELGCSDTESTLLAWGNDDSEHAKLGRAMSCSCARDLLDVVEREELEVGA